MLVVIGVFVFLMLALSAGGLIIGAVVNTVFSFIIPVISLLGLMLGLGSIVGKLITSLLSFFIKFIIAVVIFCTCVLPYLGGGLRNLYNSYPQIMNNIGWHVEHLRDSIEDAVQQQGEWLIYLWGIILVPLYYIANQIQNAARNGDNADRNENNHYGNEHTDSEDENYDDHNYHQDNFNNAARNRPRDPQPHQPQRQRLYPTLPDINYNEFDRQEANNNDNGVGNVFLNNNNMNQVNGNNIDDNRLCVVCFNRERNVAVFPCGHTWLCEQCTNNVMRRNGLCPVCQGRIREYRTIYL